MNDWRDLLHVVTTFGFGTLRLNGSFNGSNEMSRVEMNVKGMDGMWNMEYGMWNVECGM